MKKLSITEQEARELIAFDQEIDKDKSYTDKNLTPEQKAVEKKMRQTTSAEAKKNTVYKWDNRGKARKEDKTKQAIINKIAECIRLNFDESFVIENKERLIKFAFESEKYEITLTKKRKVKN